MIEGNKLMVVFGLLFVLVCVDVNKAKSIGQPEQTAYNMVRGNTIQQDDSDGSILDETDVRQPNIALKNSKDSIDDVLLNYLFARQIYNRLRSNSDIGDIQRKRSYYRQCAFNAVSCFGKRKRR